jgi:hypothetical protein
MRFATVVEKIGLGCQRLGTLIAGAGLYDPAEMPGGFRAVVTKALEDSNSNAAASTLRECRARRRATFGF